MDNLLKFAIIWLPLFNIVFPISVYLFGVLPLFFILVLPSHMIQLFLWTMVFTLVLLVDSLMGHYKNSITDGLSGLYNKQHFSELIKKELACDIQSSKKNTGLIIKQMALIVIDVDYFKRINDTYGHTAGDKVIKEISEQLRQIMTDNIIVSRFGGEEFTVFIKELENVSDTELFNLAEEIRVLMEQIVVHYEQQEIKLTASLGVARCVTGDSFDQLFKQADEALYTAKNSGRNQVHLYRNTP